MSTRTKNYDVFLSYSHNERPVAEKVAEALDNAGLSVFQSQELPVGEPVSETIRRALAVSDALVLIVPSEGSLQANSAIELGAAMAWHKPICVVRPENGRARIPEFLSAHRVYPISRLDDVVQAVKAGHKPLTPQKLATLKGIYIEMETPTDQFIREPAMLDQLADRFNAQTGSTLQGERLLYEMLRLRKRGEWPRLQKKRKTPA